MLGYFAPAFGEAEIFSSAARRNFVVFPISLNIALVFQPFKGAVKRGLFKRVLPVALFVYFIDYLVAVLVSIVQRAENDGVYVSAYEVGAYRALALTAFKFFGVVVHGISPVCYKNYNINCG